MGASQSYQAPAEIQNTHFFWCVLQREEKGSSCIFKVAYQSANLTASSAQLCIELEGVTCNYPTTQLKNSFKCIEKLNWKCISVKITYVQMFCFLLKICHMLSQWKQTLFISSSVAKKETCKILSARVLNIYCWKKQRGGVRVNASYLKQGEKQPCQSILQVH